SGGGFHGHSLSSETSPARPRVPAGGAWRSPRDGESARDTSGPAQGRRWVVWHTPPTRWPGGGPGPAAPPRRQCGESLAPLTSGPLLYRPDGAWSGTADATPDSAPGPGGSTWADRRSTASPRGTAHPQGQRSGGGDGGAASAPRYAAPRGTRCPRPTGADRGLRSAGSRPPPARGG